MFHPTMIFLWKASPHTLQLAIEDALKAAPDVQFIIEAPRELAKFLLQETQVWKNN